MSSTAYMFSSPQSRFIPVVEEPPIVITPVYFSSSRPSDGIQVSDQAVNQLLTDTEQSLEEETQKIVDKQFKMAGRPEFASDYKHPQRKMV